MKTPLAILTLILTANVAYADLFLSSQPFNSGATTGNPAITLSVGDSQMLHAYWERGQDVSDGFMVNVIPSTNGVLSFTGAQTNHYATTNSDRWTNAGAASGPQAAFSTGPKGDVNMDGLVDLLDIDPFVSLLGAGGFAANGDVNNDGAVDLLDVAVFVATIPETGFVSNSANLVAFSVLDEGIQASNDGSGPFLDQGFDASANAFYLGSFAFKADAPGVTTLTTRGQFVDGGLALNTGFGSAQITAVPEPSSFVFLGLVGLVASGSTTVSKGAELRRSPTTNPLRQIGSSPSSVV